MAWYSSSIDPKKISLTLRGLLIGLIPAAIFVAGQFGVTLGESEIMAVIEVIVNMVAAILTLVSGAMFLWGLGRKVWVRFFKK